MGSYCCSCSCCTCCCQPKLEKEITSESLPSSSPNTQANSRKVPQHIPDGNNLPLKRGSASSNSPDATSKQFKSSENSKNDEKSKGLNEESFKHFSRNKDFAVFNPQEGVFDDFKEDEGSDKMIKYENDSKFKSRHKDHLDENNENKNDELESHDLELNLNNNLELVQEDYVCPDVHSFTWRQDLVHRFMKRKMIESGPAIIRCFDCQKYFSRPGFECSVCFISLCQSCGSTRNLQKPLLLCSRNDELSWSVDSWAYTLETSKASRPVIVCSICRKLYQEPAYTCRKCLYFSCISCSTKKGFSPPVDLLKCPEADSLSLNPSPDSFFKCQKCSKQTKEAGYFCKNCPFTLCKTCGLKITLEMVRHPGISCFHRHKTMGLSQVKDLKVGDDSYCIGCLKFGMNYALLCVFCEQRICLICADRLQIGIEEFVGKEVGEGKWIKWYRFLDLGEGEKKSCVKCQGVVNVGFYFYDNFDTCYCCECLRASN